MPDGENCVERSSDCEPMTSSKDGRSESDVQAVFAKPKNLGASGRVYFAPDIPGDKLANAIAAYATDAAAETALVLVDDTFGRNGREGMVITKTHAFWKMGDRDILSVRLSDISTIQYQGHGFFSGHRIGVNGDAVFRFHLIDDQDVEGLVETLRHLAQAAGASFCAPVGQDERGTAEAAAGAGGKGVGGTSKVRKMPKTKRVYDATWLMTLARFDVYLVVPLSITIPILALWCRLGAFIAVFCGVVLLVTVLLGLATGMSVIKREATEDHPAGLLILSAGMFLLMGYIVVPCAFHWLGRERLFDKAGSPDVRVRSRAAEGFRQVLTASKWEDVRIVPTLLKLAEDDEEEVQKRAMEVIEHAESNRVAAAAIRMSKHSDWQVRLTAASVLGAIEHQRSQPVLVELAKSDPSDKVREKAEQALQHAAAKSGDDDSLKELAFWDGIGDGLLSPIRFANRLIVGGDSYVWSPGIRGGGYFAGRVLGCLGALWIGGVIVGLVKK